MDTRGTLPDMDRLAEDIRAEAEKYDLCCTVVVTDGQSERRIELGGADADDIYALDCSGGFLLGLGVLMMAAEGTVELSAPLSDVIPVAELPDRAADMDTLQLLRRRSCLPDLLHGMLLPGLHLSADPEAPSAQREQDELLAHRDLASQMALLRENDEAATSGLAPSPFEEAILARLAERVSGLPPVALVRERILRPLGISDAPGTGEENTVRLSVNGLVALMNGLTDERILDSDSMELAGELACGGHTLPFGRRQEALCARSCFRGCTVELLLDRRNGTGVLIASHSPLPSIRRGDRFARLDIDIARLMSTMSIYPEKTRMERLSARNLADAMAAELPGEQQEYVSTPAAAIADACTGQGEVFVIREGHTAVGLLTFIPAQTADTVLLDTLIIDRRCQCRGFGRIAVKWAISYLRRKEIGRLMVCVDRRNTAALALYDRLGFVLSEVHGQAFVLTLELK